jgi:hypothetical protein
MSLYSNRAALLGTFAAALLVSSQAFSALMPLSSVPDSDNNGKIDLADVIASGGFTIGDKAFTGFSYTPSGSSSPAASDIAVGDASIPNEEAIRFGFGWFTQNGIDMDSRIDYSVTVTDPNPATMIDAVDLQFNGVSANTAFADVSEVIDDPNGNFLAALSVNAVGNSSPNDFDTTPILPNQRKILVSKDIQLDSAPTSVNNFASVSFVDNSYHQTPEPVAATMLGIAGAFSMMRRRRSAV